YCGTAFERSLPDFPFGVCKADPAVQRDLSRSDMRFLQFWTWSAHFHVSFANSQPGASGMHAGLTRLDVTDCHGDWCGTVVVDAEVCRSLDFRVVVEMIAVSEAM